MTQQPTTSPHEQEGFTLVEVIVAVVILAVGLLGLAGTTGFVVRQTTLSDATTERTVARQSVLETLRARPFAQVASGSRTVGRFAVSWEVIDQGDYYKTIRVVTTGQGLRSSGVGLPALGAGVSDTLVFHRIQMP